MKEADGFSAPVFLVGFVFVPKRVRRATLLFEHIFDLQRHRRVWAAVYVH
jgi:hypothetical protein